MKQPCSVKGCEEERFSLGLCSKHYSRLRRGRALDDDPEVIEDPQRVVVVLPGKLYALIQQKAAELRKPASSYIRDILGRLQ